jgi:hypothetical protein
MKKEVKHLYQKAIDSLTLSIELFNRPNDRGRVNGVLIFMDHSFEMLLKAAILHKGGRIKEKRAKETIGFKSCLRLCFNDTSLKFLSDKEALTLQIINSSRDASQHYILEMPEQLLYIHAQGGLTLFRDVAKRVFNNDIRTELPDRVLPVSTIPPTDIHSFFLDEVEEVKKLIRPGSRKKLEALERLRTLTIMENSIQGIETQPSDAELKKIAAKMKSGSSWDQVFPGVSTLTITTKGYGLSLDLRFVKKEGFPIQVVPEGTPGAAVVAIKRVDELGFYNLGRDDLAKKLKITPSKATAAIYVFKVKEDFECYKQIKISKSLFSRYSIKAVEKIEQGLKDKPIEAVWEEYYSKTKGYKKY